MHTIEQRPPREPIVPPGEIQHHAADMSVTFSADLTLAALQEKLAAHNQWLPIDGDPAASLGALVLRNSTGPLRLGYGGWRDHLLGAQFRNGRGELISAGGRVVKNVAGYDLTKLLVGSHGVFGVPVTFTTRTYRRPAAAIRATLEPARSADVAGLLATALRPQWIVLREDAYTLGYLPDEHAAARYLQELRERSPLRIDQTTLEDDIDFRRQIWPDESRIRASVPPARIAEFVAAASFGDWSADAAFGIVVTKPAGSGSAADVRNGARALGGHAMFYDESGHLIEASMDARAFEILRRLKQAFDPDATLPALPKNVA